MKIEDLHNIISLGEGFAVEFKRSGTTHIGRELCAFANATGGTVFIGVTDHGGMRFLSFLLMLFGRHWLMPLPTGIIVPLPMFKFVFFTTGLK